MLVQTKIIEIVICGFCGSDELRQTPRYMILFCYKCKNEMVATEKELKLAFDLFLTRKLKDKLILENLAR